MTEELATVETSETNASGADLLFPDDTVEHDAATVFDPFSKMAEEKFTADYLRLMRELKAAGIERHMLGPRERAQIRKAMFMDNDFLFDEGGVMLSLMRQTHAILDKLNLDDNELQEMLENWRALSPSQQAVIREDYQNRSKNMAALYAEMDELWKNAAPDSQIKALVTHYDTLTPHTIGAVDARYFLARKEKLERLELADRVSAELNSELDGLMQGFQHNIAGINAQEEVSALDKPEGYWVKFVQKQEPTSQSVQQPMTSPKKAPENWQEDIATRRAVAALLAQEQVIAN